MSDAFRFVLNTKGVGSMLKSQAIVDCLASYADKIQNRAGDGYRVLISDRAAVSVETSTKEAFQDNMENNTLLKAIGENYD